MTFNNLLVAAGLASMLMLAGCDTNDGPAEEAGENVDNAIDKSGEKIENAGDKIQDEVNQ